MAMGHQVIHLCGQTAIVPRTCVALERFGSFADLEARLQQRLGSEPFDMIVHAAAVSDYTITEIRSGDRLYPPGMGKIDSSGDLILKLKRNHKILDRLKDYAIGHPLVVGFKLTNTSSQTERERAIFKLSLNPAIDFVVHNDFSEIGAEGKHPFSIYREKTIRHQCDSAKELAKELLRVGEPS